MRRTTRRSSTRSPTIPIDEPGRGVDRFRRAGLTAHVEFRTPATRGFSREEVLIGRIFFLPTGEQVVNKGAPGMRVEQVHGIVFSEALRDVSLAAAVASPG